MKNTYIIIAVLIVLGVGTWFFLGMGKKAEAPIIDNTTVTPASPSPIAACTQEAKICPDGSAVGRTGPNCDFAACPPPKVVQSVKEFTITGQNFSFTPAAITVKKGDLVKITFKNASGFHDFKINEFNVATKQAQGPNTEVVQFTADKTGSFQYYCSVGTHRAMGMWGTLKVE